MFDLIPASKNEIGQLKWFEFDQNNSGGYYIENDDVGARIFVQALSADEANSIAEKIVAPYSDFCECCGERWWVAADDSDGTEFPAIYGEAIELSKKGKERLFGYFGGQAVFYPHNQPKVIVTVEEFDAKMKAATKAKNES